MADENDNQGKKKRNYILIFVIVAALLLLAVLLLLLLPKLKPVVPDQPAVEPPPVNQPAGGLTNMITSGNTNGTVGQPVTPPVTPVPVKPDEKSNLKRIAMAFAERLGSFSNTSDFSNLVDLKAFMTGKMSAWADKYVADARAKSSPSAVYSGTTSRAVSAEVTSFSDETGKAEVTVKTQRHEVADNSDVVYYQDLNMIFLKETDVWRVDSAIWAKK